MNKHQIRDRYDVLAQRYERHYTSPKSILSLEKSRRAQILGEYLTELHPNVILDVGCGSGYVAAKVKRALPDSNVIGIDLSTGMLDIAHSKYGSCVSFLASDAVYLPIMRESVDVVYALGVFEKFSSIEQLLGELNRVLRPGGTLYFSYPNRYSVPMYIRRIGYLLRNFRNAPSNHHWLTADALRYRLVEAGFLPCIQRHITFGNGVITFPWSKAVSIGTEKLIGSFAIGKALAMSTVWIVRKSGDFR